MILPDTERAGADAGREPELEDGGFTVEVARVFSGPMDLLLHLVREQEVEIHEIEISTILKSFLEHLAHLERMDIEHAGDFVLMAATLMAIKARSLLPKEELDLAAELDPRDELIQRLVEYRKFRAASETLEGLLHQRERLFERGWRGDDPAREVERTLDLGELTPWDLLGLWSRFVRETLANRPHRVAADKRPIRFYVERLVERLRAKGRVELLALVATDEESGEEHRDRLIGSFVAVLELAKLGLIRVHQDDPLGELAIELRAEAPEDIDSVLRDARLDEELAADATGPTASAAAEAAARGELEALARGELEALARAETRDAEASTDAPPPSPEGADDAPPA